MSISINNNALYSGMTGLQSATTTINSNAGSLASQSMSSSADLMTASGASQQTGSSGVIAPTDDAAKSLIGIKEGLTFFKANAKIIKTMDEAVGSLLDARA